jgi:hypothetical protein
MQGVGFGGSAWAPAAELQGGDGPTVTGSATSTTAASLYR